MRCMSLSLLIKCGYSFATEKFLDLVEFFLFHFFINCLIFCKRCFVSQIINFYMSLLEDRNIRLHPIDLIADDRGMRSLFFHSAFVQKLLFAEKRYNYKNVERWHKGLNLTAWEKILIPVNVGTNHWTLAVVFLALKKICYYDSMGKGGKEIIVALLQWLEDKHRSTDSITMFNKNDWILVPGDKTCCPQQTNGVDCGIFSMLCADCLAENSPLEYSQKHMPFFRVKIACDILSGRV